MKNFSIPSFNVRRVEPTLENLFVKRTFDVIISVPGLVVLSPFIVITLIAVKLYYGEPVLYKQMKLPKDRQEFKILKFRSMCVDVEKDGVARLSTGGNDGRITPGGKVIRACRADELPQLWYFLRGDMCVVGAGLIPRAT